MNQLDTIYYLELQKRLEEIVLFVSCHDDNFNSYSVKIENLFVDTCAFFDSLCQTFISEQVAQGHSFINQASVTNFLSKVSGSEYFNMGDYRKLLESEFGLSSKEININIHEDYYIANPMVGLPSDINGYKIKPFENWGNGGGLQWWTRFTKMKHNRLLNIKEATLESVLHALGATYIILTVKNETTFKMGDVVTEIYKVFFPLFWEFKGRKMAGIIIWK